jgi:hypothetical protein
MDPKLSDLPTKSFHARYRVPNIVKLGLGHLSFQVVPSLDQCPHRPDCVRGWAPHTHLFIELLDLPLQYAVIDRRESIRMLQVGAIEIASLFVRWVSRWIQEMRGGRVVIRRPFVEVVSDIESSWVDSSVFEIHHEYL